MTKARDVQTLFLTTIDKVIRIMLLIFNTFYTRMDPEDGRAISNLVMQPEVSLSLFMVTVLNGPLHVDDLIECL